MNNPNAIDGKFEQQETGFEALSEMEFQGEGEVESESVEFARQVEALRDAIDLDKVAEAEDPEGYLEAVRTGAAMAGTRDARKAQLVADEARMAEISVRQEAILGEQHAKKNAISERERKTIVKVKKFFGLGDGKMRRLQSEQDALEVEYRELGQEHYQLDSGRWDLQRSIDEMDPSEPRREFIEQFEKPMTPDEKERLLKFDALAQLSTDEYLRLWRRMNPFFVTHVTRQGVRDHNAMIYHSAGMGEFHSGMTNILGDEKKLRTPSAVHGLDHEVTEAGVKKCLKEWVFENEYTEAPVPSERDDAHTISQMVAMLPVNSTLAAADPWADKRAIHFAQHTVLDDIYGGESGNEAFFVFPTDVIASQCLFGGHMHAGLTTAQVRSERKWNDLFVWPENGEIPVDAGLTFLPKSTQVDRKTGSRYALEEDAEGRLVMMKDEEKIARFSEFIRGLKKDASVEEMRVSLTELGVPESRQGELEYHLRTFAEYHSFHNLYLTNEERESLTAEEIEDKSIRTFLDEYSLDRKMAEDTIPAEEYWEEHFRQHPEQRPAHLIYYDGNPSQAVKELLSSGGILREKRVYGTHYEFDSQQSLTGKGDSSERDGAMLGFEAHYAGSGSDDARVQEGHERFNQLARKVIAEHYGLVDK